MPHRLNIMDNWEQIKGVLKHQHHQLTEDDLRYEAGKEDELYDRIGQRLMASPENMRAMIERLDLAL